PRLCVRHPSSFSFNAPAATELYTLSLHDALPISHPARARRADGGGANRAGDARRRAAGAQSVHLLLLARRAGPGGAPPRRRGAQDRKSTRLNSSHVSISYAVFCLKKKKKNTKQHT